MPKRKYIRLTEENKKLAIEGYMITGTYAGAATKAGVHYKTIPLNMKKDKHFQEDMEAALEFNTEILEQVAAKRAMEKSDLLMMFLLKARKPNVYREIVDHKVDTTIKIITAVPEPNYPPAEIKELSDNNIKEYIEIKDKRYKDGIRRIYAREKRVEGV